MYRGLVEGLLGCRQGFFTMEPVTYRDYDGVWYMVLILGFILVPEVGGVECSSQKLPPDLKGRRQPKNLHCTVISAAPKVF